MNNPSLLASTAYMTQTASGQQLKSEDQDEEGVIEAVLRKDLQANRQANEGEQYNPLKALTPQQVEKYGKLGIQDYLSFLRLSTMNRSVSKYEKLLKTMEIKGEKNFIDEDFPPELSSLVGENLSGRVSWKGLKWLRPKDIQGYANAQTFQGDIEPNDIR